MKLAIFTLLFALLASCSGKNAESAKKHNDEGVIYLDKEEFSKASQSFHLALSQGEIPVDLEAGILRNLSLMHSFQNHKDSAIYFAKKACEKTKKNTYYFYLTKAEYALLKDDLESAIVNYEKAKEKKPNDMAVYNSLGMIYSGKYGKKHLDLNKALLNNQKAYEISQREPLADALATSYMNLDRFNESIPLWESLIKINPSKMEYHFQLGVALYFSGQEEKGEEKMEFAAERDDYCRKMLNEMTQE